MNRIDAIFTAFSVLLVWLFAIYLLPSWVIVAITATVGAWTICVFIGKLPRRLAKETDKDFLKEMLKIVDNQRKLSHEMLKTITEMGVMINDQQATIDALMFEYCPDEMTPIQIGNYEARVRAVSQQQEDAIEQALNKDGGGEYHIMMKDAESRN